MSGKSQQFSIVNKGDYLSVTFPPYDSQTKWESQISAMYDAVDQYDARRLLIDSRATRKRVPIMELFELCIYLVSRSRKSRPRCPKIAVLVSPQAVYPDRFGENVLRNRGVDAIRFVDNEQEALEWLFARRRRT